MWAIAVCHIPSDPGMEQVSSKDIAHETDGFKKKDPKARGLNNLLTQFYPKRMGQKEQI